jgi:hypothetical protein
MIAPVLLLAAKVLVVIVLVVHGIVAGSPRFFSSLGKVDALAASATAVVDDVILRDRLEAAAVVLVVICIPLISTSSS